MRILIIATGSRGDVQPYMALGKGLKTAGHVVRFVTHSDFRGLVSPHGLDFWPIAGDVQDIVHTEDMQTRIEGGNFLLLMAQMAKEAQRGALHMARASLSAAQGMDLVLAGMGGVYIGLAVAEKLNLPLLQAYVVPFTATREYASVLIPTMPKWLGKSLNRLTHHLLRQTLWQGFRSADTLARHKVLGLPAASFWGPYNSHATEGMPILYGFSPAVVPAARDWGEAVHVTGYWFLEEAEAWSPPRDLTEFLEAGPSPVYIGFGSMSTHEPERTTRLVLDALGQLGQRAIMLSGWGGLRQTDLPRSVYMGEAIPHAWLFPRVATVVHHGGAGTTAAGLRAGVPSVILPHFGDQPFWGQRIVALGAGPKPILWKRLTAERLATAIRRATTDTRMQQQAKALGERIRSEDGIGRAAEIIRQVEQSRGA